MATERFIRGKHDDCKHDGLYSNRKRLDQAIYHQENWQEEELPLPVEMVEGVEYPLVQGTADNMRRHQDNLSRLHGYFYKGTYYHFGVGQPSRKEKP